MRPVGVLTNATDLLVRGYLDTDKHTQRKNYAKTTEKTAIYK